MAPFPTLLAALLASTALVGVAPALAQGLPTGGHVVSGGVSIGTPQGGALAITQSSQNAIVNWQGFSIGQGNRVDIRQPNSQAAILNRVTGTTRSTIAGQLNSNGQVYLVNPNGIAITRTGQVNAAGFVASTLDIADDDFKAGRRQFRGSGASARVKNRGAITIARGGYAALIGGSVDNAGTISVPMGKVGLGSGEQATLDLSGDGFLQVAVPTGAKGSGALVRHSGRISADGGSVTLAAAAARDMARQAVNLSGTVEARTVSGRNGSITLSGGDGAVQITAAARLDASGANSENGGRIRIDGRRLDLAGTLDVSGVTGGRVRLKGAERLDLSGRVLAEDRTGRGGRVTATAPAITTHAALIEASGATGGGAVRLGGGRQGGGRLAHAQTVDIDAATTIRADATQTGTGGDVVVWSDAATRFAGTISAKGGPQGGDGGQAEVSSKGVLAYSGLTDLTAANGRFGTLLLDPYNVTISAAADSNPSSFTATGNDSVINAGTLLTALSSANVTVSTGTGGSQAGNITLAAGTPLSWNTGATLTLQAAGSVVLNSAVTAQAGGLTIAAGGPTTATADLSVARFTLASGNWTQNAATLPGFATADFRVTGGSFLRAAGGDGTAATPYLLTDIYGVQGMGTSASLLAASYRLVTDIDAAGTAAWNGGLGFSPIGNALTSFTGSLDGAGHTIGGLAIARPGENNIGLIGILGRGGSVSGLGLVGGSVSGFTVVGALVGYNGGTVSQSYATSSVSGSNDVGGLVGSNGATVSQSYATGSVSGSTYVGGLVGYNTGEVNQSYVSGSVSNATFVGGLVGGNGGTITASYWDTQSTGQTNGVGVGAGATGLTTAQARTSAAYSGFDFATVWYQAGDLRPILRSEAAPARADGVIPVSNLHQLQLMGANLSGRYRLTADLDASATNVAATAAGIWGAGGFVPVGTDGTPFTGSLDGAGHTLTGLTIARPDAPYVGLIGLLGPAGSVSGLGLVGGSVVGGSAGGNSFVGSLVGYNKGGVSQSYATGAVNGTGQVGGLIGYNIGGVSQSYATGTVSTSGTNSSVGGLVGSNFSGTVSQSHATGNVSGTGSSVGGLVGSNVGTVSQSYASGTVSGTSTGVGIGADAYVGGLVGQVFGGPVSQSYATGTVSGTGTSIYVGGLVGQLFRGSVSQSYASGTVSGTGAPVGGLVGDNTGTISASYWDTQSTGQTNGIGTGTTVGAAGLTTAQARNASSYAGFAFTTVWYQYGDLRPILRSEAAPAGADGVIPVSNLHQLQLMGANLSGRYRLTADLDASGTRSTAAFSGVFGDGGFAPVGDIFGFFTGSLDGAGHTIAGLTVARPSQNYVGLIGLLGTAGAVRNLGLVGGTVSGRDSVGGLVGYNGGSITQAYTTGAVSGGSGGSVGGLVGFNVKGAITQAYATGAVSGIGGNVGGLVGYNGGGTITQAYATGVVSGTGSNNMGGLVGYNGGAITQAYATGAVSGGSSIGSLVGYNDGSITQAYGTGAVTGIGGVYLGGLVGINGGTLSATYWDTQTTGQGRSIGVGSAAGATGLTTAGMQDLSTFRTTYAGFDFATVWAPPNQTAQGGLWSASYPQLYGLSNVVAVTPTGRRTYGSGDTPIATYAGLRPGDFVTTLGTLTTAATTTSDVAVYNATASGTAVTSPAGRSYRIVYAPGTLTITPATITVTGDSGVNKTYDGTAALPGAGFTYSGVLFGDAVTVGAASAAYDSANAGSRSVLISGLSLSGAKARNYVLSALAVASPGTITRAPLTVVGLSARDRLYDGTTAAGLSGTAALSGTVYGSDAVGLTGTAAGTFASPNVGGNLTVALSGLGLTGAAAGNYSLTLPTLSASITPATLTYTADAARRTYGAATPFLSGTVTGFVGTDTLASATTGVLAFDDAVGTRSNVGRHAIAGSGLTANNGNYVFTQATGNMTALTIDPAPLTITGTRTYDAATGFGPGQLAVAGGVNGETLTLTAGTGTTASADVGTYADAGSRLSGLTLAVAGGNGLASNYVLPATGRLTITPAPVVVTARSDSSVYGDAPTNPGLSATGLVGGQDAGVLTGLANGFALDAMSPAGTYALKVAGTLTNPNYVVTATQAGRFTIDRRPITVTADARSRTYGDANPALTYQVGGRSLVNGDTLSGALAITTDARSNVGAYAIAQGSLAASPNYAMSYVSADLTVTPRAVTLSGSRSYDATAGIAGGALAAGNRVNGDVVTLSGIGTLAGRDAGAWSLADLSGLALSNTNYTLAGATGSVTITPAPVVVTARSGTSVYGDAPVDPGLIATGLVGGQDASVLTGLSNSFGVTARTGVAAGPYALTVAGTLANPNYVVTARQGGTWTVTPRPLVVTPDTLVLAYGEATPARGAASGDNLVNGDTLGSLALRTPATAGSDVGRYDLTGSGAIFASGTAANYAVTYAPRSGGLVVVPRAITVTADAQSRTYGDANPLLTFTTTALGAGQTLVGGLSTDATSTSGVGTYAITQGTLATANANYVIAYRGAGLAVVPRAVTLFGTRSYDATAGIAGSALAAGNRVNGDVVTLAGTGTLAGRDAGTWSLADLSGLALSNPNYTLAGATGTVTITPATITVRANDGRSTYGDAARDPGLSATDLVGGQGVDLLTGLSSGFGLDARSPAGTYILTVAGTLANPNYRIGVIEAGTYTIDRRPITVTADAQSRLTGQPNPALTYTVGGRGLVDGDRLTGALTADADASGAPGLYPILQGTLAAGANYVLRYRGADLSIRLAPVQAAAAAPNASGLASTAERAARQDGWPLAATLPLLTEAAGAGILLADPRSDAPLVCAGHQGGCFRVPFAPRPGPQAGVPAIPH